MNIEPNKLIRKLQLGLYTYRTISVKIYCRPTNMKGEGAFSPRCPKVEDKSPWKVGQIL